MNIIICGSISAAQDILEVKTTLEAIGHNVEIPEGVKNEFLRGRTDVAQSEKVQDKIKYDVIRGYFKKIEKADAVLVVNPLKKNIPGYIGGNTFLEMGFAHALNKKLFCLYALPNLSYSTELLATQPVILDGDLTKIK